MPLYMDIHNVELIDPEALAAAHERDLEVQEKHGREVPEVLVQREAGTRVLPRRGAQRSGRGDRASGSARHGRRRDHSRARGRLNASE